MWRKAGLIRSEADLREALAGLAGVAERLERVGVTGTAAYNLARHDALNVENMLVVADLIARSALTRTESRGSHFREDHPERDDASWLENIYVERGPGGAPRFEVRPASLHRMTPDQANDAGRPRAAQGGRR